MLSSVIPDFRVEDENRLNQMKGTNQPEIEGGKSASSV
jgi:hypothetical protein